MTVRELRDVLFEIRNQDQEIEIEDIYKLVGEYNRYLGCLRKAKENIEIPTVYLGWSEEAKKSLEEIRNYCSKSNENFNRR